VVVGLDLFELEVHVFFRVQWALCRLDLGSRLGMLEVVVKASSSDPSTDENGREVGGFLLGRSGRKAATLGEGERLDMP
jgi:hypothetical protein